MELVWRRGDVFRRRTIQISAGWAKTWFLGYQTYETRMASHPTQVDAFIIPFVRLTIRF